MVIDLPPDHSRARARRVDRRRALTTGVGLALAVCPALAKGERAGLPSLPAFTGRYGDVLARAQTRDGAMSSAAFFVSGLGIAVTALPPARADDALIVELPSGDRRLAKVLKRRGALVAISVPTVDNAPFAAVRLAGDGHRLTRGDWLVGLFLDDRARVDGAVGGIRSKSRRRGIVLDLPCPAGSPVFDPSGRVVAVVTAPLGKTQARAVGARPLLALLADLKDDTAVGPAG